MIDSRKGTRGFEIVVSDHAEHRLRERLHLNKKSIQRVAENAFDRGARYCETTGAMRRVLDRQTERYGEDREWRVYGEWLYSFSTHGVLITVLPVGKTMKKGVKPRMED